MKSEQAAYFMLPCTLQSVTDESTSCRSDTISLETDKKLERKSEQCWALLQWSSLLRSFNYAEIYIFLDLLIPALSPSTSARLRVADWSARIAWCKTRKNLHSQEDNSFVSWKKKRKTEVTLIFNSSQHWYAKPGVGNRRQLSGPHSEENGVIKTSSLALVSPFP